MERALDDAPYFRWRLSPTYLAHLFKAVSKQHHRALIPILRRILPEDGVVLDVAAHAGQFAKLFSSLVPRGQVYAFEPGGYARAILRVAACVQSLRECRRVAARARCARGYRDLDIAGEAARSYGFGLAHLGPERASTPSCARQCRSAPSIGPHGRGPRALAPGFHKADIEGWELQLVRGGLGAIRRFRPILLVELNAQALARAGDDLETAFETIGALGYRAAARDRSGSLGPVTQPRNGDIWWFPAERITPHLSAPQELVWTPRDPEDNPIGARGSPLL